MQQMKVNEDRKVCLNLEDPAIPQTVKVLRPVVYKEDDKYFCLLGPDPHNGVCSTGNTPIEAMKNWAASLDARVRDCNLDKETATYIRAILNDNK